MHPVRDTNLLREVWDGSIAAQFTLAPHEITLNGIPPPLYLMLPRNSYLPLIGEKVKKHFAPFVAKSNDIHMDLWFDLNGYPLRWHYPIGVLFAMLHPNNTKMAVEITVHFQDFPEESILRLGDVDAVEANFMSMLKEADHLKHRGQVINNMNKSQHKQLWNGLRNGSFEQFWSENAKLMDPFEGSGVFKYVPVRVYFKDKVFQRLISPVSSDNCKELTLHDLLQDLSRHTLYFIKPVYHQVFIHGIDIPLETPLQWLSEHFSYADNFLHIAVVDASVGREKF